MNAEEFNRRFLDAWKSRNLPWDDAWMKEAQGDVPIVSVLCGERSGAPGGTVNEVLAEVTGCPAIDPTFVSFDPGFLVEARLLVPESVARREVVFPVRIEGETVHLAMARPWDSACIRRLESVTGSRLKPYCCNAKAILEAVSTKYPTGIEVSAPRDAAVEALVEEAVNDLHAAATGFHAAEGRGKAPELRASVIRLVQGMFAHLMGDGASDIHVESQAEGLRIRVRKDGVMKTVWNFPPVLRVPVLRRMKLMAGMDLEQTRPQDGRISTCLLEGRDIDVRVSCLPSLHGDTVVLRVLDKSANRVGLADMGLDQPTLETLRKWSRRPNGLILVTGPTGSGKTTTLYGFLQEINNEGVKILTAEDPVEYEIPGITQVECSESTGIRFEDALRSFLRQDPDIILVGEIRDGETAGLAVKAAMTGHLVLSTLHTNDAAGAVGRLVQIGIPPHLLVSARVMVIAQRLVRRVCDDCRERVEPDPTIATVLTLDAGARYDRGRGCASCGGTGYRGRAAVMEVLGLDDELENLVLSGASTGALRQAATQRGMKTLRDAGIELMKQGVTSAEEVLRVTVE